MFGGQIVHHGNRRTLEVLSVLHPNVPAARKTRGDFRSGRLTTCPILGPRREW
ncbi:hypothetical protein FRUB_01353 [Fimbriiglobus ruber]|uniref:Uncharacterized protein n=1 Tax=Fimbriiglobus ruber TaxID=1908690 RepID=A0A225DUE9_9BACT|nr:hypothetical protein FRUB_01353 [Fimbriiglobus ruber]